MQQLALSVFALTIATLTLILAGRRLLHVGSQLVFSRLIAVGGMVAFSVERSAAPADAEYRVRFEVGGPGVFHNVSVALLGPTGAGFDPGPLPPARRHTMSAGDAPIEWTFTAPNVESVGEVWVLITWVRPYLEGIDSEAIAQRLGQDQLYEWRWYTETTRYVRTGVQSLARRYPRRSPEKLRTLPLYGRWRRTSSSSRIDMLGPADRPPPIR
ncbi:hypothetical protein BH11ACT6_BH11ACT6_28670 [soil metagenome]